MGILDDAIREHLELKRTHGASEDEIKRKEVEVFGQPRPEAGAAPPAEAVPEEHTQLLTPEEHPEAEQPGLADLEPLEPAPEDPYAVHPGDALVPDEDAPHAAEPHHGGSPAAEAGAGMLEGEGHHADPGPPMRPIHDHHHEEQHPALVDHDHIGGEEHAPEPVYGHTPVEEPPAEEPPLEEPPAGDPPAGDPPIEGEGGDEDEDVLEETPEFLQDAPEHDRLWFEQKPPRDFDFGE